jgi:type III pantothenate kinase
VGGNGRIGADDMTSMNGPGQPHRTPPIGRDHVVLVADVGNTRIKLAVVVDRGATDRLPRVARRHDLPTSAFRAEPLARWLDAAAAGPAVLLVAAVHEAAAARLEAAVAGRAAAGHRPLRQRRIGRSDLPVEVLVAEPDRVGIDRLAAAAAAALLKPADRPAIVIDCGTATTVDLVSVEGQFLGGAILPGPTLLARALAEGTSRLPAVAALDSAPPPAMPGRSTQEAIAAGIGWGLRGAVARLVAEARAACDVEPCVVLTGGSAGLVRDAVPGAVEVPDLVLAGVALAADRACAR